MFANSQEEASEKIDTAHYADIYDDILKYDVDENIKFKEVCKKAEIDDLDFEYHEHRGYFDYDDK